ncbi:MAG: type II toxin-antitoxin system Phd/YefM family antitoxin [Sulfuricellaceae bacterium]
MPLETTYTQARASFASLCNAASDDREVVIIHRRNAADVALIAADELASLLETAHLLRSPRNAERLLAALARARGGEVVPDTLDALRREVGVNEEG